MNGFEIIKMRRSIRKYSSRIIEERDLKQILDAAMSGPSCVNAQDWSFIVVRNKEVLNKMADANGAPAAPLRTADVGVLVCGDLERSFEAAKDYWIIDGAIACQNIVLAATALGIGSVWLGTYPQAERVNAQKEVFNLPEHIIPHSIIALGYPENPDELKLGSRSGYDESRVHFEKWI